MCVWVSLRVGVHTLCVSLSSSSSSSFSFVLYFKMASCVHWTPVVWLKIDSLIGSGATACIDFSVALGFVSKHVVRLFRDVLTIFVFVYIYKITISNHASRQK